VAPRIFLIGGRQEGPHADRFATTSPSSVAHKDREKQIGAFEGEGRVSPLQVGKITRGVRFAVLALNIKGKGSHPGRRDRSRNGQYYFAKKEMGDISLRESSRHRIRERKNAQKRVGKGPTRGIRNEPFSPAVGERVD